MEAIYILDLREEVVRNTDSTSCKLVDLGLGNPGRNESAVLLCFERAFETVPGHPCTEYFTYIDL